MIRETRTFWNGKTIRNEVWLDRTKTTWLVFDLDDEEAREYPDTEEGYREARLDYGRRVARRAWGDRCFPGVYFGPENVTEEAFNFQMESTDNTEEILGARLDRPRVRSIVRRFSHWLEHGKFPDDKTAEEWLFTRAYPDGRNKARGAARQLFGALTAEWKDRPDTHPLLAELAAEHPWIQEG